MAWTSWKRHCGRPRPARRQQCCIRARVTVPGPASPQATAPSTCACERAAASQRGTARPTSSAAEDARAWSLPLSAAAPASQQARASRCATSACVRAAASRRGTARPTSSAAGGADTWAAAASDRLRPRHPARQSAQAQAAESSPAWRAALWPRQPRQRPRQWLRGCRRARAREIRRPAQPDTRPQAQAAVLLLAWMQPCWPWRRPHQQITGCRHASAWVAAPSPVRKARCPARLDRRPRP
mmetsp:Transcript_116154/g.323508  ORF Transcript_116154/g.323508 Transcript_116154/m.323508 type:complete len:241 (+) Transcript_116154:717-1439(+)